MFFHRGEVTSVNVEGVEHRSVFSFREFRTETIFEIRLEETRAGTVDIGFFLLRRRISF